MAAAHTIPLQDHAGQLHQSAQTLPEQPRPVSVEEYLHTSYEDGDVEFIDGHLEERNLGEWNHADLQTELAFIFRSHRNSWGLRAVVEARLQVSSQRFRVPDLMVLHKTQQPSPVIRQAPLLCIEILSPEDRWSRTEQRFSDYIRMGVPHIWVIDPQDRDAYTVDTGGSRFVEDGVLTVPETPIRIVLSEVFATLDAEL